MGDLVIAAYRPKPGQEAALDALTRDHIPYLRRLGLITDHPSTAMRAADGTILEVFEWRDGGIEDAHQHPEIQTLWARYAAVCTYVRLCDVAETANMFATFKPF